MNVVQGVGTEIDVAGKFQEAVLTIGVIRVKMHNTATDITELELWMEFLNSEDVPPSGTQLEMFE